MNEFVRTKGLFRVYENGRLVLEADNLIVNNGLKNLAALLGGGGYKVTEMALGTGGADYSTTPPTLSAPSPGDTALETEVIRKTVDVSYPSDDVVRFAVTLGASEGNGDGVVHYSEAGLFLEDGNLFSRIIFYPRTKSPANTLTFEWNIRFGRAL